MNRTQALSAVAEAWNQAGLDYAVMHGLDHFPEALGRDLDVLIPSGQAKRAMSIARTKLESLGCEVAAPSPLWGPRLIATLADQWSESFEIHLLSTLSWRSRVLARRPTASLSVGPFKVDPWASFAKRILLPVLAGGARRLAGPANAGKPTEAELAAATLRLPPLLGKAEARDFLSAVAAKAWNDLGSRAGALGRCLLLQGWLRSPVQSAITSGQAVVRRLRQVTCPCGPVVALVGPDGVGKSSILRELVTGDKSIFTRIVVRHWRPGLLPALGALAGQSSSLPSPAPAPPRRHAGRFTSLRLLYYFFDFFLGYYARDRIASAQQALVLYDRCALDMAVDPLRYGLAPGGATKNFWRVVPKLDLVILLSDRPDRIHSRKAELEVSEIERQLCQWEQFVKAGRVSATVVVDGPPAQIAERVRKIILRTFFALQTKT